MPNQWIPISQAPKDGTSFIMWPQDSEHHTAHWSESMGYFCINCCGQLAEPTHFMFLPDPPNTD